MSPENVHKMTKNVQKMSKISPKYQMYATSKNWSSCVFAHNCNLNGRVSNRFNDFEKKFKQGLSTFSIWSIWGV